MDDQEMLLEELERYRAEKDQIRRVLGQIGGIASPGRDRVINILFLAVVVVLFVFDLVRELLHLQLGGFPHFLSTQLALFLISLKIVWMIHRQTRVDHFQFWILHSIEFQINLITQQLREMQNPRPQARSLSRSAGAGGRKPAGASPRPAKPKP
jgi:hypothetical protein